ncbi:dual specificity protein kinase splA isoform X2 [Ooceraea biroi]|uniref:dual specificity protein kinase splA isoform X2 n=1 Tax=Ooceraea biroi TaxID=2015173 RepID=UPI0005BDE878|nr:dual specificity protein kinase splA isoform X2 [Ooceraea biroi]
MVCKENVVSWFGNLSSYKRIDVMCTLLNMCLPFEVRYLGTCVEDIGKRDYNDLRDTEHHANSASELAELTTSSVTDKRTRRKLALYMALLHSCNYTCAVILYKNLSNLDHQEITNLLNGTTFHVDNQPLEELLLLYTMALNHPAFTYEQKSVFGNIFIKLQEEETRLNLSKINSSFKPTQGCTPPCMSTNERLMEPEIPGSCLMPPPPMQPYHGEMAMRNNAMVTGVPPGLTIPPPGLCLPGPEQMPMGSGGSTQYVHLGFPSVNHMPPWTVSRQSSPSQSRSPSRSNSPMGRGRANANPRTSSSQVIQSTSNTLTTSSSGSNSQTSISGSGATNSSNNNGNNNNNSLPPLPALGASRSLPSQPPLLPSSRSVPLSVTSSSTFSRHNSVDNTSSSTLIPAAQSKQLPPPPRLRSSNGDSLRETLGKEMPNFKGNLQNYSLDEIRRMSDEDLRDIGLTPNAVGQLRSIVKSQTSNGLNQISADKKLDCTSNVTHPVAESIENEVAPGMEVLSDNSNSSGKSMPLQEQHPAMHHYHNHITTPNVRRYPAVPSIDPAQIQMYPAPPQMYTAQNSQCYACLALPTIAGMPNRYSRCNAQHVYCLAQLQGLRLDSEGSRQCSHSSSSDSTGSRSPPETPPAVPWVSGGAGDSNVAPPVTDHMNSVPVHSTAPPHVAASSAQQSMPQQSSVPPESRQLTRKNPPVRTMRQKSQGILNGAGNGNGGPPSLPHCVSFPAPPTHSQLTYLPHGHFPATLRPSSGIYSNYLHGPSARPAYPAAAYQPNGEMMYPYTGHPASGSTPPPPPPNAATATPVQASYMPPTPVVTYAAAVIPPTKICCYNCGSSSHLAVDCKDQTMEDLTKKAQYRLDYTIMKQPGECPSSDK